MFSKSTSSNTPSLPTDAPRKTQPNRPMTKAKAPSILSQDLVITGEINTDGDVQIEGRLDGNIKATTITVGEQGAINGTVRANLVRVRGKVTGKINATTVELSETANVLADITQDHLTIENGAFFDGKCTRKTKPKEMQAAADKATSSKD